MSKRAGTYDPPAYTEVQKGKLFAVLFKLMRVDLKYWRQDGCRDDASLDGPLLGR
jgi:hypothetical protein